ncbi:Icc-related predicted phosphoesterase [Curtobacterium sp. PhB42]|nr:Icc-related predicted phosphoesterase [Curtobacterium sp. PhB146]TDW43069.1 Icc-related predicted phosphoesterase [Curtobacterium sp. PhB42]TDW53633.1 Icc-related predicted phosphoesterase [Curtobacterium sp. PhB190]
MRLRRAISGGFRVARWSDDDATDRLWWRCYGLLVRIAAISDVHGNVFALEAVLDEISSLQIDLIVNLGDLLSGGVRPAETADLLMRTPAVTVRGNHERQLLELPRDQMSRSDSLAADEITATHRQWIASLPARVVPVPGVLAFHGAPDDDLVYLLETVTPDGVRAATMDEVVARLGGLPDERLLLCGHTHLQRQLRLSNGALVVNPGSVGWPAYDDDRPHPHVIEAGSPEARFAVIEDVAGSWEATFYSVAYPIETAAEVARANERPDVEYALRTGRMPSSGK